MRTPNTPRRTLRWTARLSLALTLCLAPDGASADPPAVRDARACPRVFGDGARVAANREQRERRLYRTRAVGPTVEIEFRGPWTRPRRFTYGALELVGTERAGDGAARAVLRVTGLERLGCADGLYAVGVDDALGAGAHVLAVLDRDVVLVEAGGRLGYLAAERTAVPQWRLSWDSDIRFRKPIRFTASGGSPRAAPPPRAAARRPARKR